MRCKNCGWPNKPSETKCVKCGSPLDAEQPVMEAGDSFDRSARADGEGLTKTVMESEVFGDYNREVAKPTVPVEPSDENVCPKCNYPLRPGATKCPNCHNVIDNTTSSDDSVTYHRYPTRMASANPSPEEAPAPTRKQPEGTRKLRGTINPYMMDYEAEPVFMLQPLQRMNERKVPEIAEFEGREVVLNRDNTEPGNGSITSHEQAIITCSDGHWFIENRSEEQTTFVLAAKQIELHDGDIILLGNRLFKFQEQK